MSVYNYTSVDDNGNVHKGLLEGDSQEDIQRKLSAINLTLIDLNEMDGNKKRYFRGWFSHKRKITVGLLTLLTFQLGTLLSAGITLVAALQNIAEQTDNSFLKFVLLTIRTRILEGHTLAYGMNEFPEIFPELYRATVAAGNRSGQLDVIVSKLATHLEQQENIRQRIQQALIYPILLSIVSFLIMIFLLTYAMPKITQAFTESGQTLPYITLILLKISSGLKSFGLYLLLLLIVMLIGFKRLLKLTNVKYALQRFWLKVPLIRQALTIINAARFSRTFGILFSAGVSVTQSMITASNIITLLPMKDAIYHAITQIEAGVSIHQALFQTGYFTKMSTQLIASGEASGKLEEMLEKTADYQDKQVVRWTTTLLSLFEPVLIIIMGIMVLFIVLAILLPIFQMNDFFN